MKKRDASLLDDLIIGYTPHKIYAFSTPTLKNYLKVGETSRSVQIRLEEWKKEISDLKLEKEWLAMLPKDSDIQKDFFQDHALHQYFKERGFIPKNPNEAPGGSKEFYPVSISDVENGIDDINKDYISEPPQHYTYFKIEDHSQIEEHWKRTEDYLPRQNQQDVIDNIAKVAKDNTVPKNYLLFAVMRFGKTFVALEAAKKLDSKFTVIVTAKADVKGEWKKNLETHKDFDGYIFLDTDSLKSSKTILQEEFEKGNKVVLFLTLQDLSGSKLKEKHKQLFNHNVDLLIVDESHFGARAQSYGQVLQETNQKGKIKNVNAYDVQTLDDKEDNREVKALKNVKEIPAEYKLHLSGTPYKILMSSEFKNPKQIVGKVQFADILEEKENWYQQNLNQEEWKNPYFGFPQMVRFAFDLSVEAKQKINEQSDAGASAKLNEIFGPKSNEKDNPDHNKFKHEKQVLDILEALDGSKESDSIFPILDYDKIKEGKMAHHIVIVLPFKASCDAMEELFKKHKNDFNNFNDYVVVNIAGHNSSICSGINFVESVKSNIKNIEADGGKTISLTVNKMLTGVTVPEWDTMIYLKDSQSAQEYDQAIYRLQSPHISTQLDKENKKIIHKEDLKPQTILIDLAPERMMSLEQQKAFIFSASEGESGNENVELTLSRQMETSPIVTINSNKITKVEPADVIKYVAEYSSEKGIMQEAQEISVDLSILDNELLSEAINQENQINGKTGLEFSEHESGEQQAGENDVGTSSEPKPEPPNDESNENEVNQDKLKSIQIKKIQNYYLRILFYTFLSQEQSIKSLTDVVRSYDNNERLAGHLGIKKNVLLELDKELVNPFVRNSLDNKINNANSLLTDLSVSGTEKVSRAIQSFKRISDSEVFTPRHVAEKMIDNLLENMDLNDFAIKPKKFIDLTSKSGIFLVVLYEKLIQKGLTSNEVKNSLYAITTSPIAYEFTRKVFELLDIPLKNLMDVDYANSYTLIDSDEQVYAEETIRSYFFSEGDENLKFDAIVGNPPYQITVQGNGRTSPIYNLFIDLAFKLSKKVVIISPARFLFDAGQTSHEWNKKILSNPHFKVLSYVKDSNQLFESTDIKGGVAITYFDHDKVFEPVGLFIPDDELKGMMEKVDRKCDKFLNSIITGGVSYRFSDLADSQNPLIRQRIGKSFDLRTNSIDKLNQIVFFEKIPDETFEYVQIIGLFNKKRTARWIRKDFLLTPENFEKYKVIIPESNGSGTLGEILSNPFIANPNVGYTQTFLSIGSFRSEVEAEALLKYLKTKFARVMLGILKVTQHNPQSVWAKVPLQNFTKDSDIIWSESIEEIDQQLYKKYDFTDEEILFIENSAQKMN